MTEEQFIELVESGNLYSFDMREYGIVPFPKNINFYPIEYLIKRGIYYDCYKIDELQYIIEFLISKKMNKEMRSFLNLLVKYKDIYDTENLIFKIYECDEYKKYYNSIYEKYKLLPEYLGDGIFKYKPQEYKVEYMEVVKITAYWCDYCKDVITKYDDSWCDDFKLLVKSLRRKKMLKSIL